MTKRRKGEPLHDEDAERVLLGACLRLETAEPLAGLRPELFYRDNNQRVARVILDMAQAAEPITLERVAPRAEEQARVLPSYVAALIDRVPLTRDVDFYRRRLLETHQLRQAQLRVNVLSEALAANDREAAGKAVEDISAAIRDPAAPGPFPLAVMRRASEIEPEAVRWLWPNRIPLGKLALFAGDPDERRTAVALDVAARVTSGREWPDETRAEPGSVIVLSAEDDAGDTLVPRLMAAGADRTRVHLLTAKRAVTADCKTGSRTTVTLADVDVLEDALRQIKNVRLVIVDPVSAYLSATDSHKNAEVRALLAPLAQLAARYGVAIVAITHLSKSGGKAIYRAIDSIAFVGASRAAWLFGRDRGSPQRRLMLRLKGNLAPEVGGLAYTLEGITIPLKSGERASTVKVQWQQGSVDLKADDILAVESTGERGERAEAEEWLKATLGTGPRPTREVQREAREMGIKDITLRRAREALGVKARKPTFDGGWEWELPAGEGAPDDPEGAHSPRE